MAKSDRNRRYSEKHKRSVAPGMILVLPFDRPTAEMLAERDIRFSAPMSVSSWVLGDPPNGFRALDRI